MVISRQKDAQSRNYAILLSNDVLNSAQYQRQHCTLHVFEQFGALYMHNSDDSNDAWKAYHEILHHNQFCLFFKSSCSSIHFLSNSIASLIKLSGGLVACWLLFMDRNTLNHSTLVNLIYVFTLMLDLNGRNGSRPTMKWILSHSWTFWSMLSTFPVISTYFLSLIWTCHTFLFLQLADL